ncbi:MAG TPA: hypothetical protein VJ725_07315 [Thermoanaerobaculia bacterium]|nr:hypothetical protein [Thermoanaerobaculia bacterium]
MSDRDRDEEDRGRRRERQEHRAERLADEAFSYELDLSDESFWGEPIGNAREYLERELGPKKAGPAA